jgi:hypothetical protein
MASTTDNASTALRRAIWMLLLVYCAPLFLVTIVYFTSDSFSRSSGILRAFVGFAGSTDDSLSLLHRVLLPMMGGFAPLAFRDDGTARSATGLMILLILGIAVSLFLSGVFNSAPVHENLRAAGLFYIPPEKTLDNAFKDSVFSNGMTLIKGFLNRTQEAMGMYLMMLFGLKLEKATR